MQKHVFCYQKGILRFAVPDIFVSLRAMCRHVNDTPTNIEGTKIVN